MSKTLLLGLALAGTVAWGMPAAAALVGQSAALSPAMTESGIVLVAQKQQRIRLKRQKLNLSPEHKRKIREVVPAEYHQYLPKSITGGAPAPAARAAGTR